MSYSSEYPPFFVTVDLVILTIREGAFSVLLVERGGEPFVGQWALPGGFVQIDEDLADAAEKVVKAVRGVTELCRAELCLLALFPRVQLQQVCRPSCTIPYG